MKEGRREGRREARMEWTNERTGSAGEIILTEKKQSARRKTSPSTTLPIEQGQQYKYFGFIVNVSNSIEREIKERIAPGTKGYYANLKFFKRRLVTKQSKLKLYRTVIRPNLCLRNMGIERSHNSETISLWQGNFKKNIWAHKRKPNMESPNQWRIR